MARMPTPLPKERFPKLIDQVAPELQWWAVYGYEGLQAHLSRPGRRWSKDRTRKLVKRLIAEQHGRSKAEPRWRGYGNPLWQPRTDKDFERLRWAIRSGRSLDWSLV